eukprot:GAHX01002612.1.p1 GENE.GAHX01002612.1~~GAHX01002612.1.p1  ORF type:complete len:400 (+),score=64.45 GAHX01002612.1:48-1247(+)
MKNNSKDFHSLPNYGFVSPFPYPSSTSSSAPLTSKDIAKEIAESYTEFITRKQRKLQEKFDKSIETLTFKKSIKGTSIPKSIMTYFQRSETIPDPSKTSNYKSLKRLVRKGISNDRREKLWSFLFHLSASKKIIEGNLRNSISTNSLLTTHNTFLNNQHKEDGKMNIIYKIHLSKETKDYNIIMKDLPRTFSTHDFFKSEAGQKELFFVLEKFAATSNVGYCQSINFIAAVLLLTFDKEDAYYALKSMIEERLPSGYFIDLEGVLLDGRVLYKMLDKYCNFVTKKVEQMSLEDKFPSLTTHWFLSLFILVLPVDSILRIWDMFLVEGEKILFRVAIALFIMNKEEIKGAENEADLINCIMNIGMKVNSTKELIDVMFKKIKNFSKSSLFKWRSELLTKK